MCTLGGPSSDLSQPLRLYLLPTPVSGLGKDNRHASRARVRYTHFA